MSLKQVSRMHAIAHTKPASMEHAEKSRSRLRMRCGILQEGQWWCEVLLEQCKPA